MTQSTTQIAEYSPIAAVIADLAKRHQGVIFDVTQTSGMQAAKAAAKEVATYRIALEKKRTELKASVLERGRLIDGEAKTIAAQLAALEDPIVDQIKAEEQRLEAERKAKEAAEFQRVAAINTRIQSIEMWPVTVAGKTAEEIAYAIDQVKTDDPATWAQELLEKANTARTTALAKLQQMLAAAIAAADEAKRQAEERAKLEAERAELARQQAEAAAKAKAEQEARDAEERDRRRRLEGDERAARARIEEEERKARAVREEADRQARAAREADERKAKEARDAEEAKLKAEREALEAERRKLEDAARTKREEEERRERAARLLEEERQRAEREKAEAEQRAKDDAARKEREALEAKQREELRVQQEQADARELLSGFVHRFGHLEEFAPVVKAIKKLPQARVAVPA